MTPEDLRRALQAASGDAVPTCLATLDDADSVVNTWPDHRPTPTANLLTIYRRRAAHVEAIDLPTIGFREAVERLAERARAETWTYEEFLAACLQREVSARESHGGEGGICGVGDDRLERGVLAYRNVDTGRDRGGEQAERDHQDDD